MSHHELGYLARLREQGYRITPQRQMILDVICEQDDHIAVDVIYERVRERFPPTNLATVYRSLEFFCEQRIVNKTEIAGKTVYEMVGATAHHHLICRQCGDVRVLAAEHFEDLAKHLYAEHAFVADLDHLAIHGLCVVCYDAGRSGQ